MDVVKLAKLSILGSVYVRLSISGAETLGRDETVLFGKIILITLITLKFSYNYYIYVLKKILPKMTERNIIFSRHCFFVYIIHFT